MPPRPPIRPGRQVVRVVLSATALLSFMSVWKAAALAIAELGVGAFFVVGPRAGAGGGLGAVDRACGRRAEPARARGRYRELGALHPRRAHRPGGPRVRPACGAGHRGRHARRAPRARGPRLRARRPPRGGLRRRGGRGLAGDGPPHLRRGRRRPRRRAAGRAVAPRADGAGPALAPGSRAACGWASAFSRESSCGARSVSCATTSRSMRCCRPTRRPSAGSGWWLADAALTALVAFAIALPLLGRRRCAGAGCARIPAAAHPGASRRTGTIVSIFTLAVAVPLAFLYVLLVPSGAQRCGSTRRSPGSASTSSARPGRAASPGILLAVTAVLLLLPAAHAALADAEHPAAAPRIHAQARRAARAAASAVRHLRIRRPIVAAASDGPHHAGGRRTRAVDCARLRGRRRGDAAHPAHGARAPADACAGAAPFPRAAQHPARPAAGGRRPGARRRVLRPRRCWRWWQLAIRRPLRRARCLAALVLVADVQPTAGGSRRQHRRRGHLRAAALGRARGGAGRGAARQRAGRRAPPALALARRRRASGGRRSRRRRHDRPPAWRGRRGRRLRRIPSPPPPSAGCSRASWRWRSAITGPCTC